MYIKALKSKYTYIKTNKKINKKAMDYMNDNLHE